MESEFKNTIEIKEEVHKIYVSGKISGLVYREAFDKFEHREKQLKIIGFDVINPMKIHNCEDRNKPWEDYMSEDIPELLKCNSIYMQKDWGQSKGARVEYAIAKELGFKIIFE